MVAGYWILQVARGGGAGVGRDPDSEPDIPVRVEVQPMVERGSKESPAGIAGAGGTAAEADDQQSQN